jgi:hypothetical protein
MPGHVAWAKLSECAQCRKVLDLPLAAPSRHLQFDIGDEEVIEQVAGDELPKWRPRPQTGVPFLRFLSPPLLLQLATDSRYDRQQQWPGCVPQQAVDNRFGPLSGTQRQCSSQVASQALSLRSRTKESFKEFCQRCLAISSLRLAFRVVGVQEGCRPCEICPGRVPTGVAQLRREPVKKGVYRLDPKHVEVVDWKMARGQVWVEERVVGLPGLSVSAPIAEHNHRPRTGR